MPRLNVIALRICSFFPATLVVAHVFRSQVSASTPCGGLPISLPGTIDVAGFDDGGPSVAYGDSTPGNSGGAYRQTDVDIQSGDRRALLFRRIIVFRGHVRSATGSDCRVSHHRALTAGASFGSHVHERSAARDDRHGDRIRSLRFVARHRPSGDDADSGAENGVTQPVAIGG
jgi:hypothetical protein